MLSEEEYHEALDTYGDDEFDAGMGAEAIKGILKRLELHKLSVELRKDMIETGSDAKRKKYAKRLKVVDAFLQSEKFT